MNNDPQMNSFLQALSSHERWLASYVHTLIPNSADADDVLQEVRLALWKNYDQFEQGSSFSAWSKKIAFYRALAFRQKKAIEQKHMVFSQECYELLDKNHSTDVQSISAETKRLGTCLTKLPPKWQNIIAMRYKEEFSIEEIALHFDLTNSACYKTISRIRLQLRKCLTAKA